MISAEIERCAGIDVGKERLAVCVMVGPLAGGAARRVSRVRRHECRTVEFTPVAGS
jgi:hypothetical protein